MLHCCENVQLWYDLFADISTVPKNNNFPIAHQYAQITYYMYIVKRALL